MLTKEGAKNRAGALLLLVHLIGTMLLIHHWIYE